MAWFERKKDALYLHIRVSPGASQDKLGEVTADAAGFERLNIRVTAMPEKGKATKAAIRLLAKHLGIAPSTLTLVSGETARNKVLKFEGDAEKLKIIVYHSRIGKIHNDSCNIHFMLYYW